MKLKHVTFSGSMAPYQRGERRLVPDEVAAELEREGALSHSEDWPPMPEDLSAAPPTPKPAPSALQPQRQILKPQRPTGVSDRRTAR